MTPPDFPLAPGTSILLSSGTQSGNTKSFSPRQSPSGITRITVINALGGAVTLAVWVSGDGVNFLPLSEADGAGTAPVVIAAQTGASFFATPGLAYNLRYSASGTGNVYVGC